MQIQQPFYKIIKLIFLGSIGLMIYFFNINSAHAAPSKQQPAYGPFNPPPGVITAERLYDAEQSILICFQDSRSMSIDAIINRLRNYPNQFRRSLEVLNADFDSITQESKERMSLGDYRPFDTGLPAVNKIVFGCYQSAFKR